MCHFVCVFLFLRRCLCLCLSVSGFMIVFLCTRVFGVSVCVVVVV